MPTTGSHPRSLVSLDYSQYHRYYHLSSWSSLAPRRARSGSQPRRTWGQAHELCSDRALRRPAVARCAAPPGAAPMSFPAFRCLHPKRAVALLGHRVSRTTRQANHAAPVSQVKLLLPKFHRNRTRKYNNTALFVGGCWVSLTGRFHRHSAAGWAECTVAGPGRVRRHAAQFSERSSTPLIGHARVALSGVLTRLPSTQTDDTQRGGKGHKLLPAP